jgi:arylsulfatase A-like enzyme
VSFSVVSASSLVNAVVCAGAPVEGGALAEAGDARAGTARRQSVIWFFGDQHRGQALGCAGDPNLHTPNADRLAAGGVTFTSAVAGFPLCCPFRGSLVTGVYPHRCVPGHEYPLPDGMKTISHPFREAGYHTAWFGKWHLDGFKESRGRAAMHVVPPERRGGFDAWAGYDNNNAQWDSWVHGGEGDGAFHERLEGYETDALTDMLIAHVRERSRDTDDEGNPRPFFAALSVQPPHGPYVAPEEFMRRHTPGGIELRANVPPVGRVVERARRDLAGYCAQIENLDWNLGRLTAALEECGLADDTHVMFFSDHGDMHGSHGQFHKMTPYDEAVKIPFIIGGGRAYRERAGRTDVTLNHVDIAPTTLGLCGIARPEWMEGADLSHARVRREPLAPEPDSAYLQSVVPTMHGDSVDRPWRGVLTRDGWKYVCLEGQPWLMFNLDEDPFELVNLAHNTRWKAERKRLHDRLAQWVADTADDFRLPEL